MRSSARGFLGVSFDRELLAGGATGSMRDASHLVHAGLEPAIVRHIEAYFWNSAILFL